jgi:hypothetical protein
VETNTEIYVIPFYNIVIQLPGGKLITLDCFHTDRGNILFQ